MILIRQAPYRSSLRGRLMRQGYWGIDLGLIKGRQLVLTVLIPYIRIKFLEMFRRSKKKPIVLFAITQIRHFLLIRSCTITSFAVLLSYKNSLSVRLTRR